MKIGGRESVFGPCIGTNCGQDVKFSEAKKLQVEIIRSGGNDIKPHLGPNKKPDEKKEESY